MFVAPGYAFVRRTCASSSSASSFSRAEAFASRTAGEGVDVAAKGGESEFWSGDEGGGVSCFDVERGFVRRRRLRFGAGFAAWRSVRRRTRV